MPGIEAEIQAHPARSGSPHLLRNGGCEQHMVVVIHGPSVLDTFLHSACLAGQLA
jgi:hypothetical protein